MNQAYPSGMTPYNRAMIALKLESDPPPMISGVLDEVEVAEEKAREFLFCSPSEEAKKIKSLYLSLSATERKTVTLDHLAAALEIEPAKILGIITEQMFHRSVSVTGMIAAAKAPDAMKATAFYAGLMDGHQDRKLLLQATGNAPVPKTQTTYLNISGNKIDKSVHIGVPTLESVVGDLDIDKIIDAEVD